MRCTVSKWYVCDDETRRFRHVSVCFCCMWYLVTHHLLHLIYLSSWARSSAATSWLISIVNRQTLCFCFPKKIGLQLCISCRQTTQTDISKLLYLWIVSSTTMLEDAFYHIHLTCTDQSTCCAFWHRYLKAFFPPLFFLLRAMALSWSCLGNQNPQLYLEIY